MSPALDSAEDFCGALNFQFGMEKTEWTAFARRVFASMQDRNDGTEDGDSGLPE